MGEKAIWRSKLAQQQNNTNIYNIRIADLSCDSKLILSDSDEKKVQRFFKDTQFYYPYQLYISIDMNITDALTKNFKTPHEMKKVLKTHEDCIRFLEELIWRGEPVHPDYPTYKVYKCRDGWYKCKENGKEFNVLTGTIFQGTKIDLTIWFEVILNLNINKGGVSAKALVRTYGFTYMTAWHMLQKIRNAMGFENHQQLKDDVEGDEYYAGGSLPNKHYGQRLALKEVPYQNKKLLQGFVQRDGNAVIRVIPNMSDSTLNAGVLKYVEPGSNYYSDDNPSNQKLPPIYNHGVVVHSKGNYVNKDNKDIHTNNVENLWSRFKQAESTYIKISHKHVQNYANEVVFRYNTTKAEMNSVDATIWLLQNIHGTNITWRQIRDAKYTRYNRDKARVA